MKCPRCNAEVEKGEKYCNKCGKKIKSKKPIIISIAVVLVIALITVSVSFLFLGNGSPSPDKINTLSQEELTALSNENYVSFSEGFTDVKIRDEDTALKAVESVSDSIGIKDVNKELKISSVNTVGDDTYYRMNQYFNDIPVYGRDIVISADKNGNATNLTSNTINIEKTEQEENFDKEACVEAAKSYFQIDKTISAQSEDNTYLCIGEKCILCCPVELTYEYKSEFYSYTVFISVQDKSCAKIINRIDENISVSNIKGSAQDYKSIELTGSKNGNNYELIDDQRNIICISAIDVKSNVTDNTADTSIPKCVDAYKNLQDIFDFFNKNLSINSFDNNGSGIIVAVSKNGFNYEPACANIIDNKSVAEKLGSDEYLGYAVIGIGEPENYQPKEGEEEKKGLLDYKNSPSSAVDIIAHEYSHCIIKSVVILDNSGISEGICDLLGNLAELDIEDNRDNIWEIGEKTGHSKYNMAADITMSKYKDENDGHENAAILSHSAYLMWNGIDGNKDMKIDSDTLAKLWYKSLYLLHSDSTFQQCADTVTRTAKLMYKGGSLTKNQLNCVESAFSKVGLGSSLVENGSSFVVYDKNLKKFDDYHITIKNTFEDKIVVDEDVSGTDTYTLDLENGTYTITVSDNTKDGSKNKFTKTISVVNSLRKIKSEVSIYTDFGVDYDKILEQKKIELIDEYGIASTETYTENTEYLNAGWTNREGILSAEKADIDGDKINELIVIRLIKGNGNAGSSKIEVSAYKVISDSAENIGTYDVPYGNNTDKEDMTINAFTCKIDNELCLIIESDLTLLYTDLGDISYYLFKCDKGVFSKTLEIYNDADSMTLEWIKETYSNGEKKKTERINSSVSILDVLVDIGFPKTDNKFTVSGCPSFCNAKGAKKICTLKTERTDLSSPAIKFMKSTAEDFTGLDHSKASSSPEEPDKSEEWKDLYIEFISKNTDPQNFSFALVDNDDIPELIYTGSAVGGTQIAWIDDGEVKSQSIGYGQFLYYERLGLCYCDYMNHGNWAESVYRFENKELTEIVQGNIINMGNSDEEVVYMIDGKETTESEYNNVMLQSFDKSSAKMPDESYSRDDINDVIRNY